MKCLNTIWRCCVVEKTKKLESDAQGRRMEGQIDRELRAWNLAEHSTDCESTENDFTAKVQYASSTSKETTYA